MTLTASSKYATPDNPFYFTCIAIMHGFIADTPAVQFFANNTVVVIFLRQNEKCALKTIYDEHYNATCGNVTNDPLTTHYILEIPKPELKYAVDFYCKMEYVYFSNTITLDFPRKWLNIICFNVSY